MRITFVGCGDAFGSGGRFNTCFHVAAEETTFLIDCGATSLVALRRMGMNTALIDTVFITHFHADHFIGLPSLVLDAGLRERRAPLTIVGPEGLARHYERAMEAAFQRSGTGAKGFELRFREIRPGEPCDVNGVGVMAARVRHGEDENGPFFGYRLNVDRRILACSGDTEWTDALADIGRDADLMICECSFLTPKGRFHLDLQTLRERLPGVGARRVILTHMGEEVLSRTDSLGFEAAADGMTVNL